MGKAADFKFGLFTGSRVDDDGNFWRFEWLLLQNLQRCQQYYMATCYLLSAGNWLQNEWPWATIRR